MSSKKELLKRLLQRSTNPSQTSLLLKFPPVTSFINGKHLEASQKFLSTFDLFDASTGQRREYECQIATTDEIHTAIDIAQKAQHTWATNYSPMERAHVLRDVARLVREYASELAELETTDTGKPLHM